jgi:hypothetical protein
VAVWLQGTVFATLTNPRAKAVVAPDVDRLVDVRDVLVSVRDVIEVLNAGLTSDHE